MCRSVSSGMPSFFSMASASALSGPAQRSDGALDECAEAENLGPQRDEFVVPVTCLRAAPLRDELTGGSIFLVYLGADVSVYPLTFAVVPVAIFFSARCSSASTFASSMSACPTHRAPTPPAAPTTPDLFELDRHPKRPSRVRPLPDYSRQQRNDRHPRLPRDHRLEAISLGRSRTMIQLLCRDRSRTLRGWSGARLGRSVRRWIWQRSV